MPSFEGDLSAPAGRFAIVAAKFNSEIVDALLAGALDGFSRHRVPTDRIDVIRVPGAFEIPLVAQQLGKSGKYAAIVCLGAVIKGDTDHYEYVCGQAASGIQQVQLQTGVPCGFGLLTVGTMEQALDRVKGGSKRDTGRQAAEAALAALAVRNRLPATRGEARL